MRSTLMKDTIKSLFSIRRTICIEGPPGGGKTTIVRQAAQEMDVPYIERHMPTMLVEDFGVLYPDTDGALRYKLPDWFPVKGKAPDRGILCFDDRNQAGSDLQKVLANICQARNLHGIPMPDGWMVVSTGNRQSDRAGANRVLGHLSNRENTYELETHLDDWTAWAIDNNVKPELISFIRFRPGLLHDYDPQRQQNPTPRSWVEGVSDLLGVVPPEAEFESFKGAVGEGAAAEFVAFVRIFRKLPNPDAILLNPTTSDVPTDPATLYALCGALSQRATEANFDRVVTYCDRMNPPEFSVLAVSYACRRNPDLANTQAFTRWSIKHQDLLF
jgi:MoxR-like ATPase